MRTVTVRLSGENFSTAIVRIRDWVKKHRCEPTRYRYAQNDETVVMSVDFADHSQAKAFAKRFGGQSGDQQPVTLQPSDAIGVNCGVESLSAQTGREERDLA
jgi:hypothetical protein